MSIVLAFALARDNYKALLPHYAACPDKLRLSTYPAGHAVTSDMERDAVTWFCEQLR